VLSVSILIHTDAICSEPNTQEKRTGSSKKINLSNLYKTFSPRKSDSTSTKKRKFDSATISSPSKRQRTRLEAIGFRTHEDVEQKDQIFDLSQSIKDGSTDKILTKSKRGRDVSTDLEVLPSPKRPHTESPSLPKSSTSVITIGDRIIRSTLSQKNMSSTSPKRVAMQIINPSDLASNTSPIKTRTTPKNTPTKTDENIGPLSPGKIQNQRNVASPSKSRAPRPEALETSVPDSQAKVRTQNARNQRAEVLENSVVGSPKIRSQGCENICGGSPGKFRGRSGGLENLINGSPTKVTVSPLRRVNAKNVLTTQSPIRK